MSGRSEDLEFGLFKNLMKFQNDWRPLRVIFLLFISMVLLVQILVYQYWKESYRFYHLRSLPENVNVVASIEKFVLRSEDPPDQENTPHVQYPPEINATHIYGILLEPVNAKYTRNIYFTVKTTHKYYTGRLLPSMLSWLQVVDRNKVGEI